MANYANLEAHRCLGDGEQFDTVSYMQIQGESKIK
jgi:hypothetical protein